MNVPVKGRCGVYVFEDGKPVLEHWLRSMWSDDLAMCRALAHNDGIARARQAPRRCSGPSEPARATPRNCRL